MFSNVEDFTPQQFEEATKNIIGGLGASLSNFTVIGSQVLSAEDGDYQIDVTAQFEFLGASFKVLIECKHHTHPIKRDVVVLLKDKLNSLGAHKGMVFSTSEFQSGAVKYAQRHGIALVRVQNTGLSHAVKSYSFEPEYGQDYDGWLVTPHSLLEADNFIYLEGEVVEGKVLFCQTLISPEATEVMSYMREWTARP